LRLLEGFNNFLWVFWRTIRSLTSVRLYAPWLASALLQGILLFVLVKSLTSPLDRAMVPVLSLLFSDRFFHFPDGLLLLPEAFYYGNLVLGVLAGSLLGGVAAYLFAGHFSGERATLRRGVSVAFSRYPSLVVLWALESLLFVLLIFLPQAILSPLLVGSPRRILAVQAGSFILALGGVTFLTYAFISVVLSRAGLFDSLRESIQIARSRFFTTFLFVSVPFLFRLPFDYLLLKPEALVGKFNPYLVAYLLVAGVAASLVGSYLLVGNLTHTYQQSRGGSLRW
jgi:hypothetical protein